MWWWWCCEELTRDKILPWDALLSQLMYDHKLNQTIMIEDPILLCWALPLHQGHHPLNVPANKILNVHHPHPGEMHEKPDVISIETREPSLIAEIFHDQFH